MTFGDLLFGICVAMSVIAFALVLVAGAMEQRRR